MKLPLDRSANRGASQAGQVNLVAFALVEEPMDGRVPGQAKKILTVPRVVFLSSSSNDRQRVVFLSSSQLACGSRKRRKLAFGQLPSARD